MTRYTIAKSEDGATTIVDSEDNLCILAVDVREVEGQTYRTPIFLEPEMAYRVLDFLNGEEND